jgi:hypothetical protein
MSSGFVLCLGCGRNLPPDFENADEFAPCPNCLERVRVFAFPALRRAESVVAAAPTIESGEASCFYHPAKQALVACDSCGRFLCALCDIEMGQSHRCPACLESAKRKGKLDVVQTRRVLYDGLALTVATVPIIFWPLTVVTAPAALYLVVRHWRQPGSILPRTKIRFVLAAFIAFAQICGWGLLVYYVVSRARSAA